MLPTNQDLLLGTETVLAPGPLPTAAFVLSIQVQRTQVQRTQVRGTQSKEAKSEEHKSKNQRAP